MLQSDGSRTSYGYDPAGQLLRESRSAGVLPVNATFSYDPAGNRTLLIDSGLRTTSTYDAANQLLVDNGAAGRTTYGYDPAGNRNYAQGPSSTTYYTWDAHSRLTQAEPVGGPVTYAYDGDGRRMRRQAPTETRRYVYDFERVLQDTDDGGLTQRQYASTEEQYGELLSAYGAGQARYYTYDGLGSADALLAPDGTAPDRYAYRAFGLADHYQGADDNRFDWVGQKGYFDDREAGLYFLRARYYDPQTARFVSRDPDGFAAGDANLYRYAGNDPVNHTDPSGKAILVPQCQRSVNEYSWPADILRDDLAQAFGVGTNYRLPAYELFETARRSSNNLWRLDLFDYFPAEVWGKIDEAQGRGDLAGSLAWYVNTAVTSEDYIIRGQEGNNQLGGGERGWISWEQYRKGFWQQLVDVVRQVGGAIAAAFNAIVEKVGPVLKIGLAALAKAAGFQGNIDDLFNKLAEWGDYLSSLIRRGATIVGNFIDGVKKGLEDFCGGVEGCPKFLDRMLTALGQWLGIDIIESLVKAYRAGTFKETLAGAALKVLGYDWNGLLGIVGRVAGPENVTLAVGAVRAVGQGVAEIQEAEGIVPWLEKVGEQGVGQWVGKTFGIPAQDLQTESIADVPKAIWESLLAKWKEMIPRLAGEALLNLALMFVPVTGPIAWVKSIYGAVRFFLDNKMRLGELWDKLKNFFSLAVQGGQDVIGAIGTKVCQVIVDLLPLLFDLLAKVLNLSSVPDRVREGLEEVKKTAQAPAEKLLRVVATPLVNMVKRLTGGGQALTKVVTLPDKKTMGWLEYSEGRVKVMVASSPAREVKEGVGDLLAIGEKLVASLNQAKQGTAKAAAKDVTNKAAAAEDLLSHLKVFASCPVGGKQGSGACFVAGTPTDVFGGERSVEDVPLASQARTEHPRAGNVVPGSRYVPGDEWRLRRVSLHLEKGEGEWVRAELLRELEWLKEMRAEVGGKVFLDLPEMGVQGWAEVRWMRECPPLPDPKDGYSVVTGRFEHSHGAVFDLRVEGEPEPLGVTAAHPFWSVDRTAWVPASELRIGERLQALDGSTPRVVSFIPRPEPEPVYNIEVDGDHCYRVGEQGLLVHNASAPTGAPPSSDPCDGLTVGYAGRSVQIYRTIYLKPNPNPMHPAKPLNITRAVNVLLKFDSGQNVVDARKDALYRNLWYLYTAVGQNTPPVGGTPQQIRVGYMSSDTGGHIIPKQFGGLTDFPDGDGVIVQTSGDGNTFPQTTASQQAYADFGGSMTQTMQPNGDPTLWAAVNSGCRVCLRIILAYDTAAMPFPFSETGPRPYRPKSFQARWWVNYKPMKTRVFTN